MARLIAVRAFDIDELLISFFEPFGLRGGVVRQSEGVQSPFPPNTIYSDSYSLREPDTDEGIIFGGTEFAVNGNANFNAPLTSGGFTGGTVQAVFGFDGFKDGAPQVFAALEGISVAATVLQKVARSDSTADDLNLLKSILSGNDSFDLRSNNADVVRGFGGNDTIQTKGGADVLWGGAGNDSLLGGTGNDTLRGEDGRDVLRAGEGLDVLVGGRDKDTLVGGTGAGRDVFVFQSRADSATVTTSRPFLSIDVIENFTRGGSAKDAAGDRIDLDAIDANLDRSGNQDFVWNDSTAKAYRVWVRDFGDDLVLMADNTGDATADFAIRFKGLDDPTDLAAWNVLL